MSLRIEKGPVELLIIQGSPFCNIACSYCYLPDKHLTKKISGETVSKLFSRLNEADLIDKDLTIVWHAGEPLALPIRYYEQIFEVIEKMRPPRTNFRHSFQTNATLINQDWCDFIKLHHVNVGLSIDGPRHIHDKYRVKRNGKGSFDDAMTGVGFLQKNNIDFHVISVVTEYSLDYAEEIFNFFFHLGVQRLGFNIEETEGSNTHSTVDDSQKDRVFNFFQRIFELQKKENGKMIIRELEAAFNKIMGNPFLRKNRTELTIPKSHLNKPYGIISVDCDGNFMTFSPELLGQKSEDYDNFILGNVHVDSFDEVIKTSKFLKMYHDIEEGKNICSRSCEYFRVCGGGTPSNKYYENGTFKSAETQNCKFIVQFPIDIVLKDMERELVQ